MLENIRKFIFKLKMKFYFYTRRFRIYKQQEEQPTYIYEDDE